MQLVFQLFCTCAAKADRKVWVVPVVLGHGGAAFHQATLHFHSTDASKGWAAADAATELPECLLSMILWRREGSYQVVGRQKPAHHQEYILLCYLWGLCSMSRLICMILVADLIACWLDFRECCGMYSM